MAWTVAGVLAVIVIILLAFMIYDWNQRRNDLGYVIDEGTSNIAEQREVIRARCSDDLTSAACQDALADLSDILEDFSRDFSRAAEVAGTATSSEGSAP